MIGRILPSIVGDNIYYINSEGELYVFDLETGKSIWKKQTNDEVSGGLQVGFKKIIYATYKGQELRIKTSDNISQNLKQISFSKNKIFLFDNNKKRYRI